MTTRLQICAIDRTVSLTAPTAALILSSLLLLTRP
jgi:hypothetical protein